VHHHLKHYFGGLPHVRQRQQGGNRKKILKKVSPLAHYTYKGKIEGTFEVKNGEKKRTNTCLSHVRLARAIAADLAFRR
jgi:hypothetical protein